jgi:hypothetical protein
MTYGAEWKSDEGRFVLGDKAETMAFVGKATHTSSNNFGSHDAVFTVTDSGSFPLVFVHTSQGGASVTSIAPTGASGTYEIHLIYDGLTPSSHIELYCFSKTSEMLPPTSTHGLRLMSETGATLFHSDLVPLQVKGVLEVRPEAQTPYNHGVTGVSKLAAQVSSFTGEYNEWTTSESDYGFYSCSIYQCHSTWYWNPCANWSMSQCCAWGWDWYSYSSYCTRRGSGAYVEIQTCNWYSYSSVWYTWYTQLHRSFQRYLHAVSSSTQDTYKINYDIQDYAEPRSQACNYVAADPCGVIGGTNCSGGASGPSVYNNSYNFGERTFSVPYIDGAIYD